MHSLLFCFLSAFVLASPDDSRARQLYQNGVLLYDEGSYEEALLAFQEAYNLSKRHALLYNMSKTLAKMERYEEAIDALKKYRVYAPLERQSQLQQEGLALEGKRAAQAERLTRETEAQEQRDAQAAQEAIKKQEEADRRRQNERTLEARYKEQLAQHQRLASGLRYGGGALAIIGGGIAITSFVISRNQIENFDKGGYESLQPINHAGLAATAIGTAAGLGSVFLPKPVQPPPNNVPEP